MCISAGASVSGASWNTISTPSIRCVSKAPSMTRVGGIKVTVPREVTLPPPPGPRPAGPLGRGPPERKGGAADQGGAAHPFPRPPSPHDPRGRDAPAAPRLHGRLVDHAAHPAKVIHVA